MKEVSFACPICHQELILETFEKDFAPSRRLRVSVSRVPYHPLPLIAVCDARLAVHCPTSNQTVYERCDGVHVFEDGDRRCLDPMCWTQERHPASTVLDEAHDFQRFERVLLNRTTGRMTQHLKIVCRCGWASTAIDNAAFDTVAATAIARTQLQEHIGDVIARAGKKQ